MRQVYNIARRWCYRPASVLREGATVLRNDVEMWMKLRDAVLTHRPHRAEVEPEPLRNKKPPSDL